MKNRIILFFVFITIVNLADAQRNFGRRKFSRSLFSKNVRIKSTKAEQKVISLEDKKTPMENTIEPIEEGSPVDSLPINRSLIAETTVRQDSLVIDTNEEPIIVESKAVTEVISTKSLVSSHVEKKQILRSRLSEDVMASFTQKNKIGLSTTIRNQCNDSKRNWDDVVDALIYIGVVILIAALVAGFVVLYGYFPIFATVIGVLVIIVGIFAMMAWALSALFDGFLSIFDR